MKTEVHEKKPSFHNKNTLRMKPRTGQRKLDSHEIQLARHKKTSTLLRFALLDGDFIKGYVKEFDKFTVTVTSIADQKDEVVFKHGLRSFSEC